MVQDSSIGRNHSGSNNYSQIYAWIQPHITFSPVRSLLQDIQIHPWYHFYQRLPHFIVSWLWHCQFWLWKKLPYSTNFFILFFNPVNQIYCYLVSTLTSVSYPSPFPSPALMSMMPFLHFILSKPKAMMALVLHHLFCLSLSCGSLPSHQELTVLQESNHIISSFS